MWVWSYAPCSSIDDDQHWSINTIVINIDQYNTTVINIDQYNTIVINIDLYNTILTYFFTEIRERVTFIREWLIINYVPVEYIKFVIFHYILLINNIHFVTFLSLKVLPIVVATRWMGQSVLRYQPIQNGTEIVAYPILYKLQHNSAR